MFDFTRDDLIAGAQMLVTLVIALALVFFVMRPLLKRVLAPEAQPLALPVSAEIGGPLAPTGMPPAAMAEAQAADEAPAWMNNARQLGAAQAGTVKTVGTLVQDNPKQAALIVRDWLSSAT
jgi:flagellar M-ring protein FliF